LGLSPFKKAFQGSRIKTVATRITKGEKRKKGRSSKVESVWGKKIARQNGGGLLGCGVWSWFGGCGFFAGGLPVGEGVFVVSGGGVFATSVGVVQLGSVVQKRIREIKKKKSGPGIFHVESNGQIRTQKKPLFSSGLPSSPFRNPQKMAPSQRLLGSVEGNNSPRRGASNRRAPRLLINRGHRRGGYLPESPTWELFVRRYLAELRPLRRRKGSQNIEQDASKRTPNGNRLC